jgi:sugar phosphate isomerase/epimerase
VGDLGGHGFGKAELNPERVERSKLIMDLAKDLDTEVVTTHIGVVPADPKHDRYKVMQEACEQLGDYGDKVGAYFAIETGPEKAVVLKAFLESLRSRGVRVNFDPANLVMVAGDVASEAVKTLGKHIVHTHAKDGVMLKSIDPELVYTPGGMVDGKRVVGSDYFLEVPLGEGKVDFDAYLPALASTGFKGFLTIEREVGADPEGDIRKAVAFLKEKIKAMK